MIACNSIPEDCGGPETVPIDSHTIETVVDGESILITDLDSGVSLIADSATSVEGDNVYVLSTIKDMRVTGRHVQISSNRNLEQGTTQGFDHDLNVRGGEVIVSNMSGAALTTRYDSSGNFTGLIGGSLTVSGNSHRVIVHGSDTGSDTGNDLFVIESSEFDAPSKKTRLTFFGHGGDDGLVVGNSLEGPGGNLDFVSIGSSGNIELFGGDGFDFVDANDSGSSGRFGFDVDENGIRDFLLAGQEPREFAQGGINYDEVEIVTVRGNRDKNAFRVDPSTDVIFRIYGGQPGVGDGDSLALGGELPSSRFHVVEEGQGNGVWYFGSGLQDEKLILFEGVERVVESDRLAIASQPGVSPLVSVFNAESYQHLFDIQPYGPGFTGGVQVDTADMNGDSIPDIVVAPGPNRYALVQIYDGRNGLLLTSFDAFPADSPIYSENFTGGVDIAVGNVQGDAGYEIIASSLTGANDVRTFVQTAPQIFELQNSYNPFPGSSGRPGIRVDTGDFDGDGFADVVSTPIPGGAPEVAIYSHGSQSGLSIQLRHRFVGYVAGYLGGFSAATGDFTGDGLSELILSGLNTGSHADLFSGQYRVFDGATLPGNAPNQAVLPIQTVAAFDIVSAT